MKIVSCKLCLRRAGEKRSKQDSWLILRVFHSSLQVAFQVPDPSPSPSSGIRRRGLSPIVRSTCRLGLQECLTRVSYTKFLETTSNKLFYRSDFIVLFLILSHYFVVSGMCLWSTFLNTCEVRALPAVRSFQIGNL